MSELKVSKRKYFPTLDIAKFLCAVLILLYHYFSEYGSVPPIVEDVLSLYAAAVALFMVISGFLFYKKLYISEREQRKKILLFQVKRILEIYLLWSIPYLIFSISQWDFSKVTVLFVLERLQFWIFNSTFYTIWFLPSLLIGLCVSFFVNEKFPEWLKYLSAAICFIFSMLTMTYSFVVKDLTAFKAVDKFVSVWLGGSRGGLLYAFPLVTLGGLMAKLSDKIKLLPMLVMTAFSGVCLLAEALTLRKYVGSTGIDAAFFMPLFVFSALGLLLCINFPYGKYCVWLRNMSTLIFTSQRLFLTVVPSLFTAVFVPLMPTAAGFIFTFGGTLLLSVLIILLSKKIKWLKKLY